MSTVIKRKSSIGYIKWAVNIILPLIIALLPVTESFTSSIKWFMVITILAIILTATANVPQLAVSLGLPVAYIVLLKVPADVAMRAWSLEIPWLILGGFLLTVVLNRTGLLKRVAYKCILLFGGTYKGAIIGIVVVGLIASLVIADLSAKVILLSALALGICKALEFELGDTETSGIGLAALAATLGPSYLFYHGSTGTLVPMGIVASTPACGVD